jgi:hypothetical protein
MACEAWIRNRKAKFAKPELQDGRTPKTDDEQGKELVEAVKRLAVISAATLQNNQIQFMGTLATELRSLLHWKNDAKTDHNHNPLLLRMASKGDLPLPVFGLIDPFDVPVPQAGSASFFLSPFPPALTQLSAEHVLMDLQEWLSIDVVIMRKTIPRAATVERRLSPKLIIAEVANSLGTAHYDEDTSDVIRTMLGWQQMEQLLIDNFLAYIAITVLVMSKWVLSTLNERGVIRVPEIPT